MTRVMHLFYVIRVDHVVQPVRRARQGVGLEEVAGGLATRVRQVYRVRQVRQAQQAQQARQVKPDYRDRQVKRR